MNKECYVLEYCFNFVLYKYIIWCWIMGFYERFVFECWNLKEMGILVIFIMDMLNFDIIVFY